MRKAPDEFTVPGIGLLQWLARTPWDREQWYIGEDQRFYRVVVEYGSPGAVCDIDGNVIHRVVTPALLEEQGALI